MAALASVELNDLHLELLPARTVLSMVGLGSDGNTVGQGANGNNSVGTPRINILDIPVTLPGVGG